MRIDLKTFKTDGLAILIFAAVSLMFCLPQLSGKKLSQHDNISWQSMAHEAMSYHETTGKDVMWSNSMFGGMPTYATYVGTSNVNYPSYIQLILEGVGKPAYFFFIAMLGFYLLMRTLRVNKWLGMAGAFAYAFATYNPIIIGAGHDTKMLTIAYMPAALAGLMMVYDGKYFSGAALLGVVISLIFTNNHFQVIFYMVIMFACYGIWALYNLAKQGKIKQFAIATGIAGVAFLLGLGTTYTSFSTIKEYSKATMRGGNSELSVHDKKANGGLDKEYAFRWSNSIGETFCLMVPYLYGGSSSESADKAPKTSELVGAGADRLPLYWGPQPFLSGPVYFGAVVCFLFILGMMVVKGNQKWWILGASLICIILSWGKNFDSVNYFLFDHIPFLNKFRTPTIALVIPQLLFPLLGVLALQEFMDQNADKDKLWKKLKLAAGATAGICLVLGFGASAFFNFTGPEDARYQPQLVAALRDDRASLAMSSALKSAVLIIVAAALLWAVLKEKIKPWIMMAGIALLFVIDLYPVAHDYLNESNYMDSAEYEALFEPREEDKVILQDKDPYYRVLDLSRDTYNDATRAYFHKCVGGYHPAKMEIYQDLIESQLGGKTGYNNQVLNMLNTKYIIVGGQKSAPHVIPNMNANGNGWFVEEVKWAASADEEMKSLNAPSIGDTTQMPDAFNSKKTAVVRATFKSDFGSYNFGKDSAASVKLAKYGLNEISFTSQNSKDGFAVFSDIYYADGWKAYIDGKETPIYKADYVLRALKVPAGAHQIEFKFHPDSFYRAKNISMVSSIMLIGLCVLAFLPLVKKGGDLEPNNNA